MKTSFTSVLALAVLFHSCLVLGAPFTWRNRHAYYARSVEGNSTTTLASEISKTTLAKGEKATETAFVNSTTIAEGKGKATATKTQAESTASTTIIRGKSPLQTALLPKITDWNSCQSFLSNSGINLFVNQVNLNFDVVINQVTVFEILIDERGRARETRVRHAFPQPTNYFPEFDQSKNKGNKGNNKGNKGGNKGKGPAAKPTVTAIATAVTETANKAEKTATETTTTAKGKETTTTTAAAETSSAAATETAAAETTASAEATATEKAAAETTASAEATATEKAAAETTASAEATATEKAAAEATAMY